MRFRVDAYPDRRVRRARRADPPAADGGAERDDLRTIIDVPNPELKLKPGMTANVSVEIARRNDVAAGAQRRAALPADQRHLRGARSDAAAGGRAAAAADVAPAQPGTACRDRDGAAAAQQPEPGSTSPQGRGAAAPAAARPRRATQRGCAAGRRCSAAGSRRGRRPRARRHGGRRRGAAHGRSHGQHVARRAEQIHGAHVGAVHEPTDGHTPAAAARRRQRSGPRSRDSPRRRAEPAPGATRRTRRDDDRRAVRAAAGWRPAATSGSTTGNKLKRVRLRLGITDGTRPN